MRSGPRRLEFGDRSSFEAVGKQMKDYDMAYDDKKVDMIVEAAPALLKMHAGREIFEVGDMHDALQARAKTPSDFNNTYVVEVADMLVSRLDDKGLSGGPEWDAVSKAVDVVMDRNQPETAREIGLSGAQIAGRRAAMGNGMGG